MTVKIPLEYEGDDALTLAFLRGVLAGAEEAEEVVRKGYGR